MTLIDYLSTIPSKEERIAVIIHVTQCEEVDAEDIDTDLMQYGKSSILKLSDYHIGSPTTALLDSRAGRLMVTKSVGLNMLPESDHCISALLNISLCDSDV